MPEQVADMAVSASVDIGQNITALIEKLANTIGVAADKILPWYTQQSVIEGWCGLIGFGLVLFLLFVVTSILYTKSDFGEFDGYAFLSTIFLLVFGFGIVLFLASLPELIGKILTPELFATKAIIKDFSQTLPK